MKKHWIIQPLIWLCTLSLAVGDTNESSQQESKGASPLIFQGDGTSADEANEKVASKKSAKPAPLASYKAPPKKKEPKNHLRGLFKKGGLHIIWDLQVGLRFDCVGHSGDASLSYTRGSSTVEASKVGNSLSLTLVERLLGVKALLFNRLYVRGQGSYSVNSTSVHVRQGVNWAPALDNFSNTYYIGDAYGYEAELAFGTQEQLKNWCDFFVEVGGAYRRLWISESHDLRYVVPFVRAGNNVRLGERWTIRYSGGAWAFGRRKEHLTPVLINMYGVNLADGSISTQPSLVRSGFVYGFEARGSLEYAISQKWGVSLNYVIQSSRTQRKRISGSWETTGLSGWWNEQTMWRSHQVLLGVHARF